MVVVVVSVKERKRIKDNIDNHKKNKTLNKLMVPQTLVDFPHILG